MKNVFLAFLLLFSIFYDSHSQEEKRMPTGSIPLLKHFESTDYHGGIQNWSMDQNSLGILYVANNNGLLEFDGNQWILYDVPLCTKLRAVKVDQQNKVFVGGQGQIGYFDMAESGLTFTSLLDLLPPNYQAISEVWKIIEHDDKIFFNTESQIFVYDYSEIKVLQIPGYPRLAFDVENRLLVQFYILLSRN